MSDKELYIKKNKISAKLISLTNDFYNDLYKLFETNEFQNIKNKYFSNINLVQNKSQDDGKVTIMYIIMLLILHLKNSNSSLIDISSESENKVYLSLVHQLMMYSPTRNILIKHFYKFFNSITGVSSKNMIEVKK